jgi:hypothetical protein
MCALILLIFHFTFFLIDNAYTIIILNYAIRSITNSTRAAIAIIQTNTNDSSASSMESTTAPTFSNIFTIANAPSCHSTLNPTSVSLEQSESFGSSKARDCASPVFESTDAVFSFTLCDLFAVLCESDSFNVPN